MAKQRFEMTQADLEKLLEASRPTPVMFLSGGVPMGPSQQENANDAWAELGRRLGFDAMTVEPIHGQPNTVFMAEPVAVPEPEASAA